MLFHQLHAGEESVADLALELVPFAVAVSDVLLQVDHVLAHFSTLRTDHIFLHRAPGRRQMLLQLLICEESFLWTVWAFEYFVCMLEHVLFQKCLACEKV